jgi:hypothetical protein
MKVFETQPWPRQSLDAPVVLFGIVKLSEIEQKLGYTRIHHSLIIQHSGCWSEGENQPHLA